MYSLHRSLNLENEEWIYTKSNEILNRKMAKLL